MRAGNNRAPRCVQVCPTGALRVEYLEEGGLNQLVVTERLEVLHPEHKSSPSVYYKNMYRYTKCFIAGSVAVENNGITDCAEGATVKLFRGKDKIAEGVTDNFGDFKFDDLVENSGIYKLEINSEEYHTTKIEIELGTSINAGTILLTKMH